MSLFIKYILITMIVYPVFLCFFDACLSKQEKVDYQQCLLWQKEGYPVQCELTIDEGK